MTDEDLQEMIDYEYEYDREDGEFKKKIADHQKAQQADATRTIAASEALPAAQPAVSVDQPGIVELVTGMDMQQWRAICETSIVPKAYQGKPVDALAVALIGRGVGLDAMTSLNMIDFVSGKPSMSAELMVSLVRQQGHSMVAGEWTAESCTIIGTRRDSGDTMEYTFTMDDAKTAGLSGANWSKHPKSMLWARAASGLIRALFPDCLMSMHAYTPEELT